jgi:hypothetical protein
MSATLTTTFNKIKTVPNYDNTRVHTDWRFLMLEIEPFPSRFRMVT